MWVAAPSAHAGAPAVLNLEGGSCGTTLPAGSTATFTGQIVGATGGQIVGLNTLLEFNDFTRVNQLAGAGAGNGNPVSENYTPIAALDQTSGVIADLPAGQFASYAATTAGSGTNQTGDFQIFSYTFVIGAAAADGDIVITPSNAFGAGNQLTLSGGATESLAVGTGCTITVGVPASVCGDGNLENPPEECDDNNTTNGDGCDSN
ncbi:MAG: hypothetical protein KC466_06870, partial [Myxococcales bacterium]|nr:hypothetical protein [Myxococcales bacterium]